MKDSRASQKNHSGDSPSSPNQNSPPGNNGIEGSVETLAKIDIPKMYKVILLNDDFTPMEFVTSVLKRFFDKTQEQATQVMLDVHKKGAGIAGIYALEIAEMKAMQVNQFSRMNQHPLKCDLEAE